MLSELRVKNFALIKDLSVHFKSGLNVITGETGAGKSLVLKSLHLLMGGKAPSDIVGNFSYNTLVEGLFTISNRSDLHKKLQNLSYLGAEEDSLLVRRIISSKGKSKTYINGSLATVSDLKEIVSREENDRLKDAKLPKAGMSNSNLENQALSIMRKKSGSSKTYSKAIITSVN